MSTLINIVKRRNNAVSQLIAISFMFSFILFFSRSHVMAQTPDWSWASSAGETSNDYGNSICSDANGNSYITGYFSQSITFGNTTLTDAGGSDIYLVKYNNQGVVVWANSFGGTSLDYSNALSIDADGNLLITGAFRSETINFGSVTLTNSNSGNGYDAFFLTKIDKDGAVLWAKSATSDGNLWGSDLDADKDGNVVVTGSFDGASAVFGTTTLTNTYQFFADLFLVKYNASGEVLWAQSFGGNSYDYGNGVATDADGSINLIGMFQSPEISFGVTTFTNTGGQDYFIVHFNTDGLIDWLRNAPGDGDDRPSGITTNPSGDIFVSGIYSGSSITFDMTTLPGNGYDNIFILKYTKGGNIEWIQSAAGSENDETNAIAVDKNSNVLVTGEFESEQLTFEGPFVITNSSTGYSDMFVVKLSPAGIVEWATSAGGNDSDYGTGITTIINGNALITGSFYSSSIQFGSTTLMNANSTGNSTDCFVAKLNSTTGLNEEKPVLNNYLIYPNPATSWLMIQSISPDMGPVEIQVYNLNGKKLLEKSMPAGEEAIQLDLQLLLPGIYFVQIRSDNKTLNKKLVIK